jgi:hypothetical protein
MQIAASYQVLGALLTPVFVPLLVGMILMWFVPAFSFQTRRILNLVGNALLIVALVAMLYKMGSTLSKVSPWVALAALLLAAACLITVRVLLCRRSSMVQTLALANTNRHVGLALLLAGQQIHDQRTVPAIAAYALAAAVVMALYAKFA